jgi:hypothetical protein
MTLEEFRSTLSDPIEPQGISKNLLALWLDANGKWHEAHDIVQMTGGYDGDWIHAYLHRKEGDVSNSGYWYSRIGRSRPSHSLDDEWEELVRYLLDK